MALPLRQTEYPHVSIDPRVRGGQPVITGTRLTVAALVQTHRAGLDFDEILVQFPTLKAEELHAALAYYLDHKADLDAAIAAESTPPPGAAVVGAIR
jgi:uncharacterized protein (DUF433 family)